MSRRELETLLDFILNKAEDAEFEAILKACERRQRDRAVFSKLGGFNPNAAAGKMADRVQAQMGSTIDGMRARMKDFVADIILKNAPELGEAQVEELLSSYMPDPAAIEEKQPEKSRLPADALVGMLRDFLDYSEGRMAPSRQQELWSNKPRWQDEYWNAFPQEIRAFVKAYLEGRIDLETFWSAAYSVLGI